MRELPKIITENLVLSIPEFKDIPELLKYYKDNETHLAPFNPEMPDNFYSELFWEKKIPKYREMFQQDQEIRFYIFRKNDEEEVIGTLTFSQICRGPFQACYLGYGIAKKYEGHGLMYEAAGAAIEYAFKELKIHRIMANHLPENERSGRLLQRLGFVKECIAKNYLRINGVWRDHALNSLTNMNWKE